MSPLFVDLLRTIVIPNSFQLLGKTWVCDPFVKGSQTHVL